MTPRMAFATMTPTPGSRATLQDAKPLQTPPSQITPQPPRAGIAVTVNGEGFVHSGDDRLPLLWYLRDVLHLTGTKYACDDGSCGACTVHVDGKPQRACDKTMAQVANRQITTIEGVARKDGSLHPLQQAFVDVDAIQCGYCQPGWIMAALPLVQGQRMPNDADIDRIGNLCRCGIQPRLRQGIKLAARRMRKDPP